MSRFEAFGHYREADGRHRTARLEGVLMGYGLGILLLVVGLILALAVNASVSGVDIQTLGWILALGGVVVLVLTAVQLNMRRRTSAARVTTHADGRQTVSERHVESDPPPPAV